MCGLLIQAPFRSQRLRLCVLTPRVLMQNQSVKLFKFASDEIFCAYEKILYLLSSPNGILRMRTLNPLTLLQKE